MCLRSMRKCYLQAGRHQSILTGIERHGLIVRHGGAKVKTRAVLCGMGWELKTLAVRKDVNRNGGRFDHTKKVGAANRPPLRDS